MATNNPVTTDGLSVRITGLQRHGVPYTNDLGETHVYLPERLPPVEEDDAVTYPCKGGEYLHDVVTQKYRGAVRSPIDLVDVVAQYQEDPIVDTSIPLRAGRILMLPPLSYIQNVAFGESLSEFPKIA